MSLLYVNFHKFKQLLSLRYNKISDISALKELENLRHLDLSGNDISDIFGLKELKNLQSLDLSNNDISDIFGLKELKNLQSLDLSNNDISGISNLKELANLQSLDLTNTWISDVFSLKELTNLQSLDLTNTWISDVFGLKELTNLQSLNLTNTQISDISSLKELTNLQSLDLTNTRISDISPLLSLIRKGLVPSRTIRSGHNGIYLYDCPITNPPIDIIEQGNDAILRYFDQIAESGEERMYEAKLLIVGQPGAGKTTLMNKLLDENHPVPSEQESTKGINVHEGWAFPYTREDGIEYRANLWDFGGQEIQYMTHQYFLTPRSLYVLVADDRKQNANFEYWFRTIHLLGKSKDGQHSPVLVVLNENNHSAITNFDLKHFRELYPDLTIAVKDVDFSKKDGRFVELRNMTQRMLSELHHIGDKLPATWVAIRQDLQKESKTADHITLFQYKTICARHMDEAHGDFDDYTTDLSRYLHDLGILLHFQDDDSRLNNLVVLKPEWAIDAAYSVLQSNDVKENKGRFTRDFVFDLWQGQGYTPKECTYLLSMLLKDNLEISYETGEASCGEYIAPQLLPDVPPDYDWSRHAALKFRYRYPFMPPGILTRLIVRMSEFIAEKGSLVWKSGFVLEKEKCRVQIIEHETKQGEKVIDIEVLGDDYGRKYLLRDVRNEVERIHSKSFDNLDVERMIPCNCEECQQAEIPYFHAYETVVKHFEKKKDLRCNESIEDVPAIDLLEGVFFRDGSGRTGYDVVPNLKQKRKLKVFISYSKEDKELRSELDNFLKQLKRKGSIETWYDGEIIGGEIWDDKIKSELGSADIVLCLVSSDFLGTDYIMDVELPIMLERAEKKLTKVIPVILRPCPWKDTILAKFQALLGKDKPLTVRGNQDEAFMEIYKGLKRVIEAA